uniref:ATP synthase F0 subunit 8 n=1 Tax=Goniada japonica TaxID=1644143 RepID=A0A0F6T562_9ANNE|nr:ATP synthase F0 subunit 8 [Goniada japonica]AKE32083.1 ATP synthase F0 subunit 8 [Goniada japonica]
MPHLSPMSWIMAPLIFYTLMILFMSSTWWSQTSKFPTISLSSMISSPQWNWF